MADDPVDVLVAGEGVGAEGERSEVGEVDGVEIERGAEAEVAVAVEG